MINFNKTADTNWEKTKIGILGGGISGIAAAKLGRYMGADIFISDYNDSPEIIEKMCEFYSRLGRTKYTVLRHSNIYGPHN